MESQSNYAAKVRFELIERLGQGGAGSVWRSRMWGHHGVIRTVALKVVEAGDEGLLSRVRDEARLLAMLDHRALVRVQDLFELEGKRWGVAMELLEGADLHGVAAAGPVPVGVLLEIVSEVADALVYAFHAPDLRGEPLRLTHRDIKPANLLLCADGRVKLLDFGVAHTSVSTREAVTLQGEMWGTLGYMAPERLMGACTPAIDIYALGVVCYELALRRRFGRAGLSREEHEGRLAEARAALVAARIPPSMVEFVLSMMAFDAEARPSATEVRDRARALRVENPSPPLSAWASVVVPVSRAARLARLAQKPAPALPGELCTVSAPVSAPRPEPSPRPPSPPREALPVAGPLPEVPGRREGRRAARAKLLGLSSDRLALLALGLVVAAALSLFGPEAARCSVASHAHAAPGRSAP